MTATLLRVTPTDHPAHSGTPTLAIVGGGCTGLSAALHAAEGGARVVLLEGGRIGWGASGRNGGQIIPGLRKGAVELTAAYGEARATWRPPVYDRDGTIQKPAEPASQRDRPDYEGASWATGAGRSPFSGPPGTF